jgi:hypothetical protein
MPYLLDYIRQESPKIAKQYSNKQFVYLDLKYWILLRDSAKSSDPIIRQIAEKIRQLHDEGKCIFPISDIVYYEIMKQGENVKRLASITLIDYYSEGLAMVTAQHQFQIAFGYWLRKHLKIDNLTAPENSVWSKIGLVIGFPGFAKQSEILSDELQRSFFDFAGKIPLSATHNDTTIPFTPFNGKDDVHAFNDGKEKYKDQNKTFKDMFISELEGFIQELKEPVQDELVNLFVQKMNRRPTIHEMAGINPDDYCKLIIQLFKEDKLDNELPLLKIFPSLFAVMRWNKNRVYKDGNDTTDVLHAVNALPNCHYFFTEKELRSMIVQLKLDKIFNCKVESDPKKVLEILTAI